MANRYPGSSLWEYTFARFGSSTRLVDKVVTVGSAVKQLLPSNPRRVEWLVCNRSLSDGVIGFSEDLGFGSGLFVAANGGVVSMVAEEDGEGVGYPVFAVNNSAAGDWWIMEVYTV